MPHEVQPLASRDPLIAPGSTVALHLEVRFEDGLVALSTFGEDPIQCRIGDGTLTPAFEGLLQWAAPGEDLLLAARGSDLFGPYDRGNCHWIDAGELPAGIEPKTGQVIAFSSPAGHETTGVVLAIEKGRLQIDFNHPFSGRDLTLRILLLSVDS